MAAALPPPPDGVSVWRNPKNKFAVCQVHYRADPEKRTDAWKRSAKSGMPERGWLAEYEISFETAPGEPVFSFTRASHVRDFAVLPQATLIRGWDFGFWARVVLFFQVDPHGRLRQLREVVLKGGNFQDQIDAARSVAFELYGGPPPRVFDCGDPAGTQNQDMGQVQAVLAKEGIFLQTLRRDTDESYRALERRLTRLVHVPEEGMTPAAILRPENPMTIAAFSGGFHRHPKTGKPVDVHPHKDVMDVWRYVNDCLEGQVDDRLARMKEIARIDRVW